MILRRARPSVGSWHAFGRKDSKRVSLFERWQICACVQRAAVAALVDTCLRASLCDVVCDRSVVAGGVKKRVIKTA